MGADLLGLVIVMLRSIFSDFPTVPPSQSRVAFTVFALTTGVAGPAFAVVLHPGAVTPGSKPADEVVGRWGSNASVVVVGKEGWAWSPYVLTTRHQGGGLGTSVVIDAVTYTVAEVFNEPAAGGSADLRVARLEKDGSNAELGTFAQLYDATDEAGQATVIGGFGKGRGAELTDGDGTYYEWSGAANTTQRWGQNDIEGTLTTAAGSYTSATITLDFDSTVSDAALASWDSGGGWFLESGGTWHVAGLSAYVETIPKSYFLPADDPDINEAIRVSSYSSWIDSVMTVPEPSTAGLLLLGGLALRRRRS